MGNPLPSDGVVGYLTAEQQQKLKIFWKEFLNIADKAPAEGKVKGVDKSGMEAENSKKDAAGKDIPKDDAAKDRMRAEIELKEAKEALEKYGRVRFMETFWNFIAMDNPDVLMLRFCRARKWEIPRGVSMLAACMKWRIESGVEDIVKKGEEGYKDRKGFLEQFSSGKTYTQGTDRAGRPVVYIHVCLHKVYGQPADVMSDYVFSQMEAVRCLLADRADKITMVFDMTSFGLSNMDWRVILLIVKCLEAYYPESLNVMIIHRAPFIFSGIWKILGPMFDPVVRAKVCFTKTTEDLLDHIAEDHLVKRLGGKNDFEWHFNTVEAGENEPMEDTNTRDRLLKERKKLVSEYEKITREWLDSDDHTIELQRDYLASLMRYQYFQLDPYIRGRTVYHRHGNIVGNGLVHFSYPGLAGGDQWEVRGFTLSRETMVTKMDRLRAELKAAGAKVPAEGIVKGLLNDGDGGGKEQTERKRRPSRSK